MSLRTLWVGAVVVACAWSTGPARADGDTDLAPYVPPDFMSATPPLPADMQGSDVWRLALSDALAIAMRQNLGIIVEEKSIDIAELGLITAGAAFEPQLTAMFSHSQAVEPPPTSVDGSVGDLYAFRGDGWALGISQMLETGTTLSVGMTNGRNASTLGTAVAPLDYTANVSATISQPLLRGFSLDRTIPRMALIQAHIGSEQERYKLALTATSLIQQTEDAYWDVLQSLYSYDLEVKATQRARDQEALTKRQIAAGTLAPSELLNPESQVAQHELNVLQDEQSVETAFDKLRGIMNLPRDQWTRPILPTEVPHFAPAHVSAEEQLAIALKSRPELAQADLGLQISTLAVRSADNNKLPSLNLSLTASTLGENSTYGQTLDQTANLGAHSWGASVNLVWTPMSRATGAQAVIARRQREQAVLGREQLVQQIWLDVRAAVRTQTSKAHQVIAAAAARKLAEQTLEVEQRKFMNGTSKNIDVANLQGQLQAQQLAELAAVLDHRKAVSALLVATGRLLSDRNIELTPAKK
jgi:HAE1 family hydrophobic/amphiphilic exporter-1